MPSYSTEASFVNAIVNGPLKESVENFIESLSDDIYENVLNGIYDNAGSKDYVRTGNMKAAVMRGKDNSITVTSNGVNGETGMSSSAISANKTPDGFFNQHMSFDGSSVVDNMIPWFEGEMGNSSPHFKGKVCMLKNAYMDGQKDMKSFFSKAFWKAGFRITGR